MMKPRTGVFIVAVAALLLAGSMACGSEPQP